MAFFYYSGSILFIISKFNFNYFLISIEKVCAFIMKHNNLFIAMFCMILTWRVVHMGLFPLNTLLFFAVLILVPCFLLIVDKTLLVLIKRK